jgi:plasmid stabilization system protein ParE
MAYLVRIAPRAERDLSILFEDIHAGNSEAALKWYEGLKAAVVTLEKLPNRYQEADENSQLRQLLYGKKPHIYRVIYRVREEEKRVHVLHIRHAARHNFMPSEIVQDGL